MNIFEFRDQLIDDDASYINSFIQIRDPTFTTTFSRNCTKRLEPPPADPAVPHEPRDFATFQDHGYMGLYGGLRENQIHARKGLTSETQKILDYMGSEELGANIFRATQTDAKLRREQIQEKEKANQAHRDVGRIVRKAIAEAGGTMPENLPTPEKSIQELQREQQKQIEQSRQLSLFDDPGKPEDEQQL